MYLIGYDLGSSSVKAALVDAKSGKTLAIEQYPEVEMEIISHEAGWAEQEPNTWWDYVKKVTDKVVKSAGIDASLVQGIGISYQMHGLVLVDENNEALRPSIIWCDSRAVEIGNQAFDTIGHDQCLKSLLNSPGNFTASKLKWVKDNEPEVYAKAKKMMLPGDFIAMKMSGEIKTTISGLSEGMLWDFENEKVASFLLDHYGISEDLIPEIVPSIGEQGTLSEEGAKELGLTAGISIGYRAGDQPNNALSLNVFEPGEVAATGGTSGVVYGVVDKPAIDPKTRVNGFAHVNHTSSDPRVGVLLCINGAGIQYNYVRQLTTDGNVSYPELEAKASEIAIGSDGLKIIPFGNGAERVLENQNPGSHISNLHFNLHTKSHFYRAALEGIAFSFIYGMEIMQDMGLDVKVMKVGNDNLFQSEIFSTTIASVMDCEIQMLDATGAVGAAKASGVAAGAYSDVREAFQSMETIKTYKAAADAEAYKSSYQDWKKELTYILNKN
ncbi:xylulokinase [Reichenbachiella ulvae]|uniref:FGGY family carbohydrate kinase n=1 Tax=Reichenbachiella ulvae TaxID=2980104 RepID=A0ABT3CNC6_9BACT|nr:FGGY family carbohydrate kinase [Reichenbachiella ulvae]MCV9385210.1 FGGY family carbohydrate kinase [Reichenbachiella ulvae]